MNNSIQLHGVTLHPIMHHTDQILITNDHTLITLIILITLIGHTSTSEASV
eukprot:m.74494 g.74494  ORF g.74494 m.74494 type:complete len:51 (-) comp24663_c0_seq1:1802-1954(-)